jgi:hypothetical protein
MRNRIRNILSESLLDNERLNINDAFWEWFGDSRIVDSNGNPLVVYHGTNMEFDSFNDEKIGMNGNNGFVGRGFYFSPDKSLASAYGHVISVFLSLQNPFDLTKPLIKDDAKFWGEISQTYAFEEGDDPYSVYNALSYSVPDDPEISQFITDGMLNAGYDGIIVKGRSVNEIVAFRPTQIKSIFNEGTWNIYNSNIMK